MSDTKDKLIKSTKIIYKTTRWPPVKGEGLGIGGSFFHVGGAEGVFVLLVLGRGERACEANYMVHLHLQNFPKLKPSFIQLQVWGYTKIIECHSVLSLERRPFLGCRQYDCLHSLSIEASRGTQTRINNFIPVWSDWIRNYSNGSMEQI